MSLEWTLMLFTPSLPRKMKGFLDFLKTLFFGFSECIQFQIFILKTLLFSHKYVLFQTIPETLKIELITHLVEYDGFNCLEANYTSFQQHAICEMNC